MTEEHSSDLWNLREGDQVTVTTETGFEVSGQCTGKSTVNSEGVNITEQTSWTIEVDDGVEYIIIIVDGISGTEGESPFPMHHPLTEKNSDDEQFGYVTEIQHD